MRLLAVWRMIRGSPAETSVRIPMRRQTALAVAVRLGLRAGSNGGIRQDTSEISLLPGSFSRKNRLGEAMPGISRPATTCARTCV